MPKEFLHWHIAHGAGEGEIPAVVRDIISKHSQLYYLGAVAHDIPFYDLSQPAELGIERIGNQLHGVNGEHTLVPLIGLLESCPVDSPAMVSFVLGMLTHYVADSTFHPLVYYLTGNYFAEASEDRNKAVFRHRLLETAFDLWVHAKEPLNYPDNLARLWRESGRDGRQAFELLVGYYAGEDAKEIRTHFQVAWRYHRILQTAFQWSVPWKIVRFYARHGHPGVQKHEALFYRQPIKLEFLEEHINWRHPVTGEAAVTTLAQHYQESIERVITLFRYLGTEEVAAWPGLLRKVEPLSLDSGLPYIPVQAMKYFSMDPIELRLLS